MRGFAVVATFTLLVASAAHAVAQFSEPRQVTQEQKQEAISDLAKMLRERYVLADVAEKAARFLEEKLAKGGYDADDSAQAFSGSLTVDLQRVTADKHLRFGLAPPPAPAAASGAPSKPADAAARRAIWLARIRRGNYGLVGAEILPGNVGYLAVRRFQPPDVAGDTVVAAMGFLANADAIIVDVRNCRGGSAFMMPLFAGYFFSRSTHLFDMEFRGDDVTEHFWTLPYVPGSRLADIPMYILTSTYTFSGAEGFAYRFQVLERAKIVGETTGGGANAGGARDIAPFFRVYMPMGRPVDSKTGSNWEGTGVAPDIKTPAREALHVAHIEALQTLRENADSKEEKARLDWALERVKAGRHPVDLDGRDLERFAGTYGPRRIWAEGGQLRYAGEETPVFLLERLTDAVFAAEAHESLRLEFVADAEDRIESVIVTTLDGQHEEYSRDR
jgi:hypothetical protein